MLAKIDGNEFLSNALPSNSSLNFAATKIKSEIEVVSSIKRWIYGQISQHLTFCLT